MQVSDAELAHQAAAGDRAAFGALIHRHYDLIFRVAFRFSGHRQDAEDLTQEICIGLARKIAQWHGQAQLKTWLYRVIVNACHDKRRRDATQAKAALGWGERELALRQAASEEAAAQDWLWSAMGGLSPVLRDTAALTVGEDLTHAQAGEILGVSEGTISWRMSEVKKHLRDLAQKETADG
ncbi:RNA polymerase sigma factor [Roseobacter sp. YSTF-M11]|uniref:RNA polymerase sigma factor n=1 Tax=Roseobacter insulae TaxID=2859783 RepID=A0A9X1K016_9RHOB|nr:RNA polymerase sigma factor [Roseobacter insulae]